MESTFVICVVHMSDIPILPKNRAIFLLHLSQFFFFLVLSFQASLPVCAEIQAFLSMEFVWERSLQWAVLSALAVSPAICWGVHQRELAWPTGRGSAPNPSVRVRNTYKYLQCFSFFSGTHEWIEGILFFKGNPIHPYSRITLLGRRLLPIIRLWFQ